MPEKKITDTYKHTQPTTAPTITIKIKSGINNHRSSISLNTNGFDSNNKKTQTKRIDAKIMIHLIAASKKHTYPTRISITSGKKRHGERHSKQRYPRNKMQV